MKDHYNIWQIGAGSGDRIYVNECIKWGVGLLGPGQLGNMDNDHWYEKAIANWNKNAADTLRRFANLKNNPNYVTKGDRIVLRAGKKAYAVGEVVGDYEWDDKNRFNDIHGWDLRHYRRVNWNKFDKSREWFSQRMSKLTRVDNKGNYNKLAKKIHNITIGDNLPRLPHSRDEYNIVDLRKSVPKLCKAVTTIKRIKKRYETTRNVIEEDEIDYKPSERELTYHYFLPILISLGWKHSNIGIEFSIKGLRHTKKDYKSRSIDIALFNRRSRLEEDIVGFVEMKSLSQDIEGDIVNKQVNRYRKTLPNLQFVLISNGLRSIMHTDWKGPFRVCGYLNLLHLADKYLCLNGWRGGAPDLLKWLSADEWVENDS